VTAPLTLPESERVADWPRISATLRADGTGSITVTDADSANGVELATTPAVQLTPGVPSVIAAGTTLLLGDVHWLFAIRGVAGG